MNLSNRRDLTTWLSNLARHKRKSVTLADQVRAILNKYNATMLLPGVSGVLRFGYQPGNYRESTGQTLAAADQQVGLVVDAARAPGPELVVNGDFSNGTTRWTAQGSAISVSAGKLSVTTSSGAGGAWQDVPTVAGRTYEIVAGFDSAVSASLKVYVGGAFTTLLYNGSDSATIRQERAVFQATSSSCRVYLRNTVGSTCLYDNISVRELPGIHASQSTSGFQPVVRNEGGIQSWQFDGTDDRLSLSAVPFQMADDHFVVAGFLSNDNTNRNPFSLTGGALATFAIKTMSGNVSIYARSDSGASLTISNTRPYSIGSNVVVSTDIKTGQASLYLDGVFSASGDVGSLGATTFTASTIGGLPSSQFHNGLIHGLIVGKGAISASERQTLVRFMASLQGRTL